MSNGVERSGRHQEATQVIFQRVAGWVAVDGLGHTIVTFNDTKLRLVDPALTTSIRTPRF